MKTQNTRKIGERYSILQNYSKGDTPPQLTSLSGGRLQDSKACTYLQIGFFYTYLSRICLAKGLLDHHNLLAEGKLETQLLAVYRSRILSSP